MTKNKTLLIAVVATAAAMAAFWFLALAPKREEVKTLDAQIAAKQTELQTAQTTLAGYHKSKDNYGKNYATVVRLGKAVPEDADIRSLLVQLDAEAGGTNVDFRTIEVGSGAAGATQAGPAGTTPAATPAPAGGPSVPTTTATVPGAK